MKAVIYARTGDPTQDLQPQIDEVKAYCVHHNYEVVQVYRQLEHLIEAAQHHTFDVVVVRDLARFSRRIYQQTMIILQLEQVGIKIETMEGEIDHVLPDVWKDILGELHRIAQEPKPTHDNEKRVREYLDAHPNASARAAARDLGISPTAAARWYKVIKQAKSMQAS